MLKGVAVAYSSHDDESRRVWETSDDPGWSIYIHARALKLPVMQRAVGIANNNTRGQCFGLSYAGRRGAYPGNRLQDRTAW